jgi:hypothetical protein
MGDYLLPATCAQRVGEPRRCPKNGNSGGRLLITTKKDHVIRLP